MLWAWCFYYCVCCRCHVTHSLSSLQHDVYLSCLRGNGSSKHNRSSLLSVSSFCFSALEAVVNGVVGRKVCCRLAYPFVDYVTWPWICHFKRVSQVGGGAGVSLVYAVLDVWYTQYSRMSPQQIKYLADLVSSDASKVDTNWRKAVSVEERLAVTLRYWWAIVGWFRFVLTLANSTGFWRPVIPSERLRIHSESAVARCPESSQKWYGSGMT